MKSSAVTSFSINSFPVTTFFRSATLAFVALLALSACSSKKKAGLDDGSSLSEADLDAQREARFRDGNIPGGEDGGPFRNVRFDYDSAVISSSSRQDIDFNAGILQENAAWNVSLEGHTDERGTAEYNMALGAARARSVKEALVSYGIESSRLTTISYGEEVPLEQGSDESAFAKNRRVHFSAHSGN